MNLFNKNNLNYEERLKSLREELVRGALKEQTKENRFQFGMLLCAVPSVIMGIPFMEFDLDLSAESIEGIKNHLKNNRSISDRESAVEILADMKNFNGAGVHYDQFVSFWNNKPVFDITKLNKEGQAFFCDCMNFAQKFAHVVRKNGFSAWDIGECINVVRDCYFCGYLDRDLSMEIIRDFTQMALDRYDNWFDYAISYICGGTYFMYRITNKNEEHAKNMFEKLVGAVKRLFLDDEVNVWSRYKWYEAKRYFKDIAEFKELIDSDKRCFVTDKISVDGCKIGYMYREHPQEGKPDSGWRFFEGSENEQYLSDGDNVTIFDLNAVCNYDKDIIPLLDSEYGTAYFRDESGRFVKEELNKEVGKLYPVNIEEYSKYILVHNADEEYILKSIDEYCTIYGGEKTAYNFKYYFKNNGINDIWAVIKCPQNMDFYNYHNLSEWFYGSDNSENAPDLTAVVSIHNNESESYYATPDLENTAGDTLIGIFNNNTRFYIELPSAFKENGNITTAYNKLSEVTVRDYLASLGLNEEDLTSVESREHKNYEVSMSI